jgi:hypothetical protein
VFLLLWDYFFDKSTGGTQDAKGGVSLPQKKKTLEMYLIFHFPIFHTFHLSDPDVFYGIFFIDRKYCHVVCVTIDGVLDN